MNFCYDVLNYKYPSRREVVYGRKGMVCTSQSLAAQAGLDIIKAGGNAVDAALATAACMIVLEPTSNGFGSDASLGQGGDIPIHIGLRRASEQKTRHGQQAQQGLWAEVRRHVGAFQGPEEPCSVLGLYSGRL